MDMLIFELNKNSKKPLYEQLYVEIKNAIISRRIEYGTKLPSKRKLSEFLNISQTTIEIAYAQLLAEGYIISVPRVGYFVEAIDELPYIETQSKNEEVHDLKKQSYQIDFHPGSIDVDGFPFSVWRKYAKNLIDEQYKELLLTGHPQGEFELRAEIAKYLFQSRGVLCVPEQIVIGSGTEQLLPMIVQLFDKSMEFAIENPGYKTVNRILTQHRRKVHPIEVDEEGIIVANLDETDANIVYITPSHQFPTGAVLSATRRSQLLNWAVGQPNRYIIEDDYDSEFRYFGKPISSLQGIDKNEKVIYMSTFTKSLMPSLRVAYFVLPKSLLPKYQKTFTYYNATVPRFDQHLLANFMKDGYFAKHLNRMRKIYKKKHDRMMDILEMYYPTISVSGEHTGMNIVISVPHLLTEKQLKQLAAESSIGVYPLSDYMITPIQHDTPKFLLGFGGLKIEQIEDAIHQLMSIWKIEKEA
ncbi:GntR family transcriptional regulator [Ureibacillus massiliensis 4400831 = CIP 108448 = CCUG 49529]|uniref:GntR family transcriptional regulator n=1 Tax=Ureibacillus massiliensis 4400831 = CIP 108448 = CCUG 49529 TaxID=1211035 RepID=A0A0A3IYA0_9BACL|nr:PLP-dependent aminotransferase family protein [Ureibacillus massiliensis]KGR89696.1 GntR family transcriptional regulator [Ureibacillus massiliensis 4400831 = CIP 108448 = CCUG 49529]